MAVTAEVPSALAEVALAEDATCFVAVSMGSGIIIRRSWTVAATAKVLSVPAKEALAEEAPSCVAVFMAKVALRDHGS